MLTNVSNKKVSLAISLFFPQGFEKANANNMASLSDNFFRDKPLLLPSDARYLVTRVSFHLWEYLGSGGRLLNNPFSNWVTIGPFPTGLGRIQDLRKGGSDKQQRKAVALGGSGGMLPRKILILAPLKCDFQRFLGQFEVV